MARRRPVINRDDSFNSQDVDPALLQGVLQPLQDALRKQLQEKDEQFKYELREKEEGLKRATQRRDIVGKELAATQAKLSRLQAQLEAATNECVTLAEQRQDAEDIGAGVDGDLRARQEEVAAKQAELETAKAQAEHVAATLKQLEAHADELQSNVAVMRRATHKAESALSDAEKATARRLAFVQGLQDKVYRLNEEATDLDSQIAAQREQTVAADALLADATQEMESIAFEKRQMLQQWRSTVAALSKRDEALARHHQAIRDAADELAGLERQAAPIKAAISAAIADNGSRMEALGTLESTEQFVARQLARCNQKRESLSRKYAMMQKSLHRTNSRQSKLALEQQQLQAQIAAAIDAKQSIDRQRRELEGSVQVHYSEKVANSKAVHALDRAIRETQKKLHAVEVARVDTETTIDATRLQANNIKAQLERHEAELAAVLQAVKDKDALVERHHLRQRRLVNDAEAKMAQVAKLNQRLERLRGADGDDEHTGPLEATVKHLQTDIQECRRQQTQLQRQWMVMQRRLVDTSASMERMREQLHEVNASTAAVERTRLRVETTIAAHNTAVAAMRKDVAAMHLQTQRLNKLIAETERRVIALTGENTALDKQFAGHLKDMRAVARRADKQLLELKEAQATLLEQVLEADLQVRMWQEKIRADRAAAEALDKDVGRAEIEHMQQEIYRMESLHNRLDRKHEALMVQMERAIERKEGAQHKRNPRAKARAPTAADIRKLTAGLEKDARRAKAQTRAHERKLADVRDALKAAQPVVQEARSVVERLQQRQHDLEAAVASMMYSKQRGAEELASLQRLAQSYTRLLSGAIKRVGQREAPAIEAMATSETRRRDSVRSIIHKLSKDHPDMAGVLDKVALLATDPFRAP